MTVPPGFKPVRIPGSDVVIMDLAQEADEVAETRAILRRGINTVGPSDLTRDLSDFVREVTDGLIRGRPLQDFELTINSCGVGPDPIRRGTYARSLLPCDTYPCSILDLESGFTAKFEPRSSFRAQYCTFLDIRGFATFCLDMRDDTVVTSSKTELHVEFKPQRGIFGSYADQTPRW